MWPNLQETANLVTFTEEILNGKLHFLCSEINGFWRIPCQKINMYTMVLDIPKSFRNFTVPLGFLIKDRSPGFEGKKITRFHSPNFDDNFQIYWPNFENFKNLFLLIRSYFECTFRTLRRHFFARKNTIKLKMCSIDRKRKF